MSLTNADLTALLAAHASLETARSALDQAEVALTNASKAVLSTGEVAHARCTHPGHAYQGPHAWWLFGADDHPLIRGNGSMGICSKSPIYWIWVDEPALPAQLELGQAVYDAFWERQGKIDMWSAAHAFFIELWEAKVGPLPRRVS